MGQITHNAVANIWEFHKSVNSLWIKGKMKGKYTHSEANGRKKVVLMS